MLLLTPWRLTHHSYNRIWEPIIWCLIYYTGFCLKQKQLSFVSKSTLKYCQKRALPTLHITLIAMLCAVQWIFRLKWRAVCTNCLKYCHQTWLRQRAEVKKQSRQNIIKDLHLHWAHWKINYMSCILVAATDSVSGWFLSQPLQQNKIKKKTADAKEDTELYSSVTSTPINEYRGTSRKLSRHIQQPLYHIQWYSWATCSGSSQSNAASPSWRQVTSAMTQLRTSPIPDRICHCVYLYLSLTIPSIWQSIQTALNKAMEKHISSTSNRV